MAYPRKRNTVTATTLTGLILAGVVATAIPANADENNPSQSSVQLLNPLQDYSSQDYANAHANLAENTNTRQDRVEVETGTTRGETTYTVYSERINYTRYNADGENSVDTITNYSIESDFPSDPEVVAITDDLKAEHDGSDNTYFMDVYDRSEFPYWQQRDGINQRNYVLARDLQDVEWNEEGTRVLSGWHIDPFLDERVEVDETNISSEIDIDHVLPLSYAWSDYHYKDRDDRRDFANYDMNLLAVNASENRIKKSDLSPAVYMPPNEGFHCDYALMWTHTSMTQDISLNTQDIGILDDTLHECVINAVGEETEEMLENIAALEAGTLELSREEVENFSTESEELSWDFSAQDVDHISGNEVESARAELLEAYDNVVNDTEEPSPEPTEPDPSEDPTPEPEPSDEPTEEPTDEETPAPDPSEEPTDEPTEDDSSTENPEEPLNPEASIGMDILQAGESTFINILGFQPYESVEITINDEVLAVFETDEEGYVNDEITIPEDLAAGEHTLTVTGQESGETLDLSFTVLEQDEEEENTVITPDTPQHNQEDNTVTIPDTEGLEYLVDGEVVSGTVNIPENGMTVTVSALDGFVLDENVVTEWVYAQVIQDEDESESEIIEITVPQHNQEENTVTIPETEGLDYVVDGEVVTGTINIPESGLTVTVELHEGYSFVGTDNAPVWTYDYFSPQEEEEVNEENDTNNSTVVNDTRDDRDATASDDTDTTVERDTDSTVALERADDTTVELDENGEPVTISSGNTPNSGGLAAGGAIALGSLGALAYGATRIRKAAHK